ncbi:MAG: phytoene/squalene synthase family protein [Gemmatimonadetes bacterium]|nr:phytoene/squalene synthase family protein [Gemmatimonadota bacterium]
MIVPNCGRPAPWGRETDARATARIVRRHARTFSLASRLLPAPKRRAVFALYAFCRVADDLVDLGLDRPGGATARQALDDLGRALVAACGGATASDPVLRELQWAVREYGVPLRVLQDLLAGVARDLEPQRYASWGDLERYCEGVASTVGVMCTHVFGVTGEGPVRAEALRCAHTLGIAMQLTNILRDVGEDAARGRCYLPDDDLARFGLAAGELRGGTLAARDPRWVGFMGFEVGRARALYAKARPGIALLHPDSQRCATACADGYAGILSAIEANRYDSFGSRARLNAAQRLRVLWSAWRNAPAVAGARLPGR